MEELEQLRLEVEFLRKEIRRKDNDWLKAWRRTQRLFNDKCAEVLKLEELVVRLAKPKEEGLKYG